MNDLADDPADRASGLARLKAMVIWSPASGSKFTLSSPFAPTAGFRCAKGWPMWNGWKKAAIGLSALLAFVLLELMAVIGGVAVFLGLVMDVDLPFFAASEE
jgi:hypothetical protein